MKRVVALAACATATAAAATAIAAPSSDEAALRSDAPLVACMGTRVNADRTLRVGPFVGYISAYDVVRRRFALRVGELRAPGLSQKIPWYVQSDKPLGETLRAEGVRLRPGPPRSFTQEWPTGGRFTQGQMYPSIFAPTGVGCWRITLTTGTVSVRLFALVRPRLR